jgi:hypothetical protein
LLKLVAGAFLVVGLLLVGYRYGSAIGFTGTGEVISVSDARECLLRGGTIYFNVTFGNEQYLKRLGEWEAAEARINTSQAFVINANTHTGTIRDLSLKDRVFLVADGIEYPAVGDPLVSTTHHNTYLVFFPNRDMQGETLFDKKVGGFDVLIKKVQYGDRKLTFNNPLPGATRPDRSFVRMASLIGSALAALLVACTPCLVGSLAVGSLTMSAAGTPTDARGVKRLRTDMARKTIFYLLALAGVYIAVAATINLTGLDVENLRPVELVGGALLLIIGLSFISNVWPIARITTVSKRFARFIRRDDTPVEPTSSLGPGGSSAMGASLALVCSVAGAPTLSTAILLPVMVYAGLNDLYWSMAILGVYLLLCSIPFFLISMGLGELLMSASLRMRKALLTANAALLIGLGLLLVVDTQRVADYLAAPADIVLVPFKWMV